MINAPAQTNAPATENVFQKMHTWQNNNQKLDELDATLIGIENEMEAQYQSGVSEESIFATYGETYNALTDEYTELADQTPLDFSFLEGADPENYNEKLKELALGEIKAKDTDGDSKLSYEEYALANVEDLGEEADEEAILDAITDAYYLFNGINEETKLGDDGLISPAELAFFYKNMDGFENGEQTKNLDGILDYPNAVEYVVGQTYEGLQKINGNPDIDRIKNLYSDILNN